MKTIYTTTRKKEKAHFWSYLGSFLVLILLTMPVHNVSAQSGKLKLKADIVNVDDAQTSSLITLFRLPKTGTGTFVLGQFIVEGNDWFKTHLELDKNYMVEIAATNGLTKRFYFDTNVPSDLQKSNLRMNLTLDMGWDGEQWPVVKAGEISFEDRNTEFAFDNRIKNNAIATEPKK